jgi:hypothetical protein
MGFYISLRAEIVVWRSIWFTIRNLELARTAFKVAQAVQLRNLRRHTLINAKKVREVA